MRASQRLKAVTRSRRKPLARIQNRTSPLAIQPTWPIRPTWP